MKKLSTIKTNERNPRKIEKHKLEKLADSIKAFPKMMELRPIVVNKTGVHPIELFPTSA